MNKAEYVQVIEKALVGHVSPQELQDTVAYYRDYIEMEIRKGRTEQEVLESLGNPRLLAKTIIDAKGKNTTDSEYAREIPPQQNAGAKKSGFHIPLLMIILIVLLFVGIVFGILFSIAKILLPIVLPVLLVLGIISFFKKRNRK